MSSNKSTKRKIGDAIFKIITSIPGVHNAINKTLISKYADTGQVPGVYTTEGDGLTSMHELVDKKFFSLVVPKPTAEELTAADLPPIEALLPLFKRKQDDVKSSRVSLLLPFFAQHLTDAVFQSANLYETDAPHEIVLNQIYGNTIEGEKCLRSGQDGKLKINQTLFDEGKGEFPPALCEQVEGEWKIKEEFQALAYLSNKEKVKTLFERYKGREQDICAVGLFQGNMTLGNFAITTLLLREHNRLCDLIKKELEDKCKPATDEIIFKKVKQVNIVTYMKLVVEDYINTFAGQKIFKLDTKSFFYEKKYWCRASAIPYHFNILYRLHSMIPNTLNGFEELGFAAFLNQNRLVVDTGLGNIFHAASAQAAGSLGLGNTHEGLLPTEFAMLSKGRGVLGSYNAHREAHKPGSSHGFDVFDPEYRDELKRLYKNDINNVDYAVGIFAELPKRGIEVKMGLRDGSIMGSTLMDAIAKHAFRHILSNRYMSRDFLNPEVMTTVGWNNLQNTDSVETMLKRNVPEMREADIEKLVVNFNAPEYR